MRAVTWAIGIAAATATAVVLAMLVGGWTGPVGHVQADDALPVPADVELHVGDVATFDGGALQVALVQVEEDSRCPSNVMCVWQGRAVVRLHATVDGVDRGEVTASLDPGSQRSPDLDAVVDRYVISLTDLQPYPQTGQSQPIDQRVATMHVRVSTP
jgi:hypothetical protein